MTTELDDDVADLYALERVLDHIHEWIRAIVQHEISCWEERGTGLWPADTDIVRAREELVTHVLEKLEEERYGPDED
jgi:hypothetical protein